MGTSLPGNLFQSYLYNKKDLLYILMDPALFQFVAFASLTGDHCGLRKVCLCLLYLLGCCTSDGYTVRLISQRSVIVFSMTLSSWHLLIFVYREKRALCSPNVIITRTLCLTIESIPSLDFCWPIYCQRYLCPF